MFSTMDDESLQVEAERLFNLDENDRGVALIVVALRIARSSEQAAEALQKLDRETLDAFIEQPILTD